LAREGASLTGDKQLLARLKAISEPKKMLGYLGTIAVGHARKEAPRKTSNLSRTIRLGQVTDDSVEIIAGGRLKVGYAFFVHEGTKPHIIRPRRAKVLAWGGPRTLAGGLRKGGRATHFAREVKHPGTKPNRFLIRGIRMALARAGLKLQIRDAWNRAA
jgi:hypothetical protein